MAYNALAQHEHDAVISPIDSLSNYSRSPPPDEYDDDHYSPMLFLAKPNSDGMQDSADSPTTRGAYDMLDDRDSQASPVQEKEENDLHVARKRAHERDISQNTMTAATEAEQDIPSMRSASLRSASVDLRHPTPDVSMPGSMVGNVEHLERTAERLSMTSDMALEIQKMHLEQKRSDSRRSSLLASPDLPPKQFASNSIVEINNAARSGGYSPGGFMISPRSSLSNRGRSASKGSRYSSRPEPDQEGRPLDSFVNSLPPLSPVDSRASSFAEGAEMSTMARALAGADVTSNPMPSRARKGKANSQSGMDDSERPATSASQTTIEQAQKMFQDFDGVHSHHFVSRSRATSGSVVGSNEDTANTGAHIPQIGPNFSQPGQNFTQPGPNFSQPGPNFSQPGPNFSQTGPNFPQNLRMYGAFPEVRRMSQSPSGLDARISAPMPTGQRESYLDPKTGQPMVYYPAPVPAVLNLPQKLSNKPSSIPREQSSSQALQEKRSSQALQEKRSSQTLLQERRSSQALLQERRSSQALLQEKRSSQALSNVPEVARESVLSLPDFLDDHNSLAVQQNGVNGSVVEQNGETEKSKIATQQKRASTGTRRNTQDFSVEPPPQMRAIAFFNHPSLEARIHGRKESKVEAKGGSASGALDSILDASVTAPAGAKTGEKKPDNTDEKDKRRRSSFGQWLARASGLEYDYNTIATDLSAIDIQKAQAKEKEKEKLKERRRSLIELSEIGKVKPGEEDNYETTPLHPVFGVDPGDEEGQFNDEQYLGPPTTLLAELQIRKQQARQRTKPITSVYPNGIHSTLLELDTVAEAEKKARERKRVNLAWEGSNVNGHGGDDDDDDVPLGLLYPGQKVSQPRNRPVGLLERRDLEDSEPLSRRRDRLRPAAQSRKASSMLDLPLPGEDSNKRESFLATSRPVSGDFASELMSQFGGDLLGDNPGSKDKGKGKAVDTEFYGSGPVPEEEETLAQRKKRLRAERQAREAEVGQGLGLRSATMSGAIQTQAAVQEHRPQLRQRRSMADILSAHPTAGRQSPGPQLVAKRTSSYSLGGGLLGLHDQEAKRRSSALTIDMMKASPKPPGTQKQPNRASSMTLLGGMGMAPAIMPQPNFQSYPTAMYNPNMPQFVSPTMGMGYGQMNMNLVQQQQYMMAAQMGYAGMPMMMPMAPFNPAMQMGMAGFGQMGMNGQIGMGMGMGMQQMPPLSQGQRDMVERWRESVQMQ